MHSIASNSDVRVEKLLDLESTSLMMMTPSVSTVTFFEGRAQEAQKHLTSRVDDLVRLNPWLAGRIGMGPDGHTRLTWSEAADSSQVSLFSVADDAELEDSGDYEALIRRVGKYCVPNGRACLNTDTPLFRVTLIRRSESKFAVCVSLSHVIGDGYTFYSLYGMLSTAGQPRALKVERHQGFSKSLSVVLGGDDAGAGNDTFNWMMAPGMTMNIITTLLFSRHARILQQKISDAWVEKAKRAAVSENTSNCSGDKAVQFVSTNEVVTSALLNATGCDCGIMAVNFRGRVPGITSDLAGNYEGLVAYQREDFRSPGDLRRSISTEGVVRRVHGDIPFPGFVRSLTTKVGLVSTWASFYVDLLLPGGASQLRHMPIVDTSNIILADICIVFRSNQRALEVLALTRSLDQASLARTFTA